MTEPQPRSVALNDVSALIRALKEGGDVSDALGEVEARSGCEGCHGCRGTRGSVEEELVRSLPLEAQVALKRERIKELQRQIEEAEQRMATQPPAQQG